MRDFHRHCLDWLLRLGQSPEAADTLAWTLVEHASDARRLRQQPYCVIRPGSEAEPVFLAGINSERLREPSGVMIVLDVAAMKSSV